MNGLFRKVLTIGFVMLFLGAIGSAFFKANMLAYAAGTIYIRANGLVEGTDKITNENNVTYTFTDDINDSIVVERSNIIIDGDEYTLTGPYTEAGFTLTGLTNVTIRNVSIVGFGYGIYLQSSTLNIISNNNITFNEGNIYLENSSDNTITGNTITDGAEAVQLWASFSNTILDNSIMHNGKGVWLRSGSTENVIHVNNITASSEAGVYLDESSGNIVMGNNITDSEDYGVYLTNNSTNNTISGNNIRATVNGAGIYLNGSPNNVILGNNIKDSPNEHICLLSSSNNNIISGNTLTNSTADVGIYVYACSLNSFFGNNITVNVDTGIRLDSSSDSTISENNISENLNGVYLWYSSNITVSGNNIAGNSQNGIYLYSSNENAILSNEFYSNPNAGIYLYSSSDNIIWKNTNSSGWGSQYGIVLWSGSHRNTVSENILSPFFRGIAMGYSDDNCIMNNTVSNTYSIGIEIQQICNNSIIANNMVSNSSLYGISILSDSEATRYNVIQDNNITHNLIGIYILRLSGNIIYHNNFIDNTNQTSVSNSTNVWDDGYPSGGNYWSDYNGTDLYSGPSQDIPGSDFIGDDPYVINDNNTDHYPLMIPYETTPPAITILSPENKTYAVNASIPLTFTVDETTTWIGYSLDSQANVTITGNTTLPTLPDGWHYVTIYANDTSNNMGMGIVYFTVDTTKPDITSVLQDPLTDVLPDTVVRINATVTDATSGIKQALLNCTFTNSTDTWYTVFGMTPLMGDTWNATVPPYPYGTNVTYVIIAEDNAGNTITTEQIYGYKYEYQVVPEFTLPTVLIALVIATSLIAIISRKKRTLPT